MNPSAKPVIIDFASLIDFNKDENLLLLSSLNSNLRIELNREQKIIIAMPTGSKTGNINSKLNFYVNLWNEVLSPDVSFALHSKLVALDEDSVFFKLAPDFVIELKSDSDSLSELMAKMEEYLENGTQYGWLVDPSKRKVHFYRLNGNYSTQSFEEAAEGEGFMEKLKINWRNLFPKE
jgi:Uma2 family endonuclease